MPSEHAVRFRLNCRDSSYDSKHTIDFINEQFEALAAEPSNARQVRDVARICELVLQGRISCSGQIVQAVIESCLASSQFSLLESNLLSARGSFPSGMCQRLAQCCAQLGFTRTKRWLVVLLPHS